MSSLKPINNTLLFTFVNNKTKNNEGTAMFQHKTDAGIIVQSFDMSANEPQWGIVLEVGPTVDPCIKPGCKVLIESLQWTEEHKINNVSFWKTDDTKLILVEDKDDGINVGIL